MELFLRHCAEMEACSCGRRVSNGGKAGHKYGNRLHELRCLTEARKKLGCWNFSVSTAANCYGLAPR